MGDIAKPKMLAFLIFAFIIVIVLVVYFSLWRPSDSAVQGALSDINTLQESATVTMPLAFESISTPIGITADMAKRFKQRVDTYASSLDSLEKSAAIQRSFSTKMTFDTYKSKLGSYGQQLKSLSESISVYGAILNACDTMVAALQDVDTKSEFDERSAACDKALTDTKSSPNQIFNEGFLHDYSREAKRLLSAYGQYFAIVDSGNTAKLPAARSAIDKAGNGLYRPLYEILDYKIVPPSSDVFTKFIEALNSQKKSFLR